MKTQLANWGNYPVTETELHSWRGSFPSTSPYIARGMGRSYGDASLGRQVCSMLSLNCMLNFNAETGVLIAESGVTLDEILTTFVPRGYFLPVTPGTKYISLGGAVAADVHGKNHHSEGGFCDHVEWIELMTEPGCIQRCSAHENQSLFNLTRGGMGLTGIILTVALSLKKIETAYIRQSKIHAPNFYALCDLFETHKQATYSVAWVDCLAKGKQSGRSILMLGEHATLQNLGDNTKLDNPLFVHKKPTLQVPFFLPGFTLNRFTVGVFNSIFYHKNSTDISEFYTHYDPYFYPLDAILHWNRIYGKQGFIQYQFVIPYENGKSVMQEILERISHSGMASFLAVLKVMGKPSGVLSFPMEGYTLALDFPMRPGLLNFLNTLDALVLQAGGRIYLAKDARMSAEMFHASYAQNATDFISQLHNVSANSFLASALSERLRIV
jgi:decaprenylphospho-beta-D-ribofuranose 2-oxidase